MWHYLIGVDNGHPWIAQVSKNIDSLAEAVEKLKPAAVKRAEAKGLKVKRQGDWFFIPVKRPHHTAKANGYQHGLDGDHVPTEMMATKSEWEYINRERIELPAGSIYVRGKLDHSQHNSLNFGDQWHKAIQNNAIRTGRLALGGGAD
jgi:hypothetical protein